MGSKIVKFPTGTHRAGSQSARSVFHPLRVPPGPGVLYQQPPDQPQISRRFPQGLWDAQSSTRDCAPPSSISPPGAPRPQPQATKPRPVTFFQELRGQLPDLAVAALVAILAFPYFVGLATIARYIAERWP